MVFRKTVKGNLHQVTQKWLIGGRFSTNDGTNWLIIIGKELVFWHC